MQEFEDQYFDDPDDTKTRKLKFGSKLFTVMVFGVIAILGSTFAANINLNSGQGVEFGQGVTQMVACDDEITLTPVSTFVNEEGGGAHYFSALKVSGIDSSSHKCSGKNFEFRAYSDVGTVPLFVFQDSAVVSDDEGTDYAINVVNDGGEFTWISRAGGDDVIQGPVVDITNTSFTLSFFSSSGTTTRRPLALAEDVKRITLESKVISSWYRVDWNDQGATTPSSGGSSTYEAGFKVAKVPTRSPLRDGYIFGGWWTGPGGSGTQVQNDNDYRPNPPRYITFYAKWIEDA